MSKFYLLLIVSGLASLITVAPAAYTGFFLTLILLLTILWGLKVNEKQLNVTKDLTRGCGFAGEDLTLTVNVVNNSKFPIFWCIVSHSFIEQLGSNREHELISLRPHGRRELAINFRGTRRGIYNVPETKVLLGDIWSLREKEKIFESPEQIVIYPAVSPVMGLNFARHNPLGGHRVLFGLYEDQSRLRGCRDYVFGDNLKRIHWPNFAKTGQLQIKEWETTLNADVTLFLNLREEDFPVNKWFYFLEFEVEMAASLVYHFITNNENIGFYCNGKAFGQEHASIFELPSKRGKEQGQRILSYLAGVEMSNEQDFESLMKKTQRTTAGSRLIFLTPRISNNMILRAVNLRNSGYFPLFLSPSKKHDLPLEDLRKYKLEWYLVKKGRENDVFQITK